MPELVNVHVDVDGMRRASKCAQDVQLIPYGALPAGWIGIAAKPVQRGVYPAGTERLKRRELSQDAEEKKAERVGQIHLAVVVGVH